MEQGLLHLYWGDGKGKTTAAMGLALRALGSGKRVVIVQFLKGGNSGEIPLLAQLGAEIYRGKAGQKFVFQMTPKEKAATRELQDQNLAAAMARPADLLVPPDMDLVEAVRAASSEGKPLACVLCDESQFFTAAQAEQLFMVTVDLNIPVICYGLRSDFSLKGFPGSTRLLELAHTIEEMKTICACGRKATCNCRKVNGRFVFEGEQVAIDLQNDVQYVSMCPQCYFRERRAFYAARR